MDNLKKMWNCQYSYIKVLTELKITLVIQIFYSNLSIAKLKQISIINYFYSKTQFKMTLYKHTNKDSVKNINLNQEKMTKPPF